MPINWKPITTVTDEILEEGILVNLLVDGVAMKGSFNPGPCQWQVEPDTDTDRNGYTDTTVQPTHWVE
jgi:hypothetical protein